MARRTFHARYAEFEARIAIDDAMILSGLLPPRATALVREWAAQHRAELAANWERASTEQPLATIDPLP